jgi:hypothetical protein
MNDPGDAGRWTLSYAKSADKDRGRLDRRLREQVLAAREQLTENPAGAQLARLTHRPA